PWGGRRDRGSSPSVRGARPGRWPPPSPRSPAAGPGPRRPPSSLAEAPAALYVLGIGRHLRLEPTARPAGQLGHPPRDGLGAVEPLAAALADAGAEQQHVLQRHRTLLA